MNDKKEKIEFGIEKVKIEPKERKFEIGKFAVCSETGQPVKQITDATGKQIWLRSDNTTCEKITTLKEFYEKKYNKPFIENEWSFVINDINNITGINQGAELVNG